MINFYNNESIPKIKNATSFETFNKIHNSTEKKFWFEILLT